MATTHRIANMIKDEKILDEFFKLEEHDLLKLSTAMRYFGKFKGKIMCHPYDLIQVPIGVYGPEGRKNKNTFTTTIGKYWFNKVFIEKDLFDLFDGWFGDPVNDDTLGDISDRLSFALLEDKIELRVLKEFLMKCQKFQPYSNVLATGFSERMLTISSKLEAKKKALLKKYEKEIAAGDEIVSAKIEKEVLDEAKKLLAEAGYPDGKGLPKITYTYPSMGYEGDVAQVLQQQWKLLGVEVELQALENEVYVAQRRQKKDQMIRMQWYADYNDPTSWLKMYQTGNAQNDVNWSNADYDKLIEESDKNLDEASRQEQLLAAEKILVSDDTVICPLFSASNQDLIDPSLTGYYNDGLAYTFWYNAHIKEDTK